MVFQGDEGKLFGVDGDFCFSGIVYGGFNYMPVDASGVDDGFG